VTHRIAAVIVVYRPEREPMLALLRAVAGDVDAVFLFLNEPLSPELLDRCAAAAAPSALETLGTGVNVGLGRAYNEATRAALDRGCDLLLLFDEDSAPRPGMAGRLAAAFDRAAGKGRRIAAIGPQPVVAGRPPPRSHPATDDPGADLREPSFLISSGSLIDLGALFEIGPFREDFFIDGIDVEWCFRARARGFRCAMLMSEAMPHRLGVGVISVPVLGVPLIDQNPVRLFTYARNQVAMMRLPHVPMWWKARTVALMALRVLIALIRRSPGRERAAILRGIRAGLRLELGPPVDALGRRAV
jgi:rhamnosyltransferase